jgi:hypothetical protein
MTTSVGDWQPPEDDSAWKIASFDPPGDAEPFLGSVKITTYSAGGKKGKPYIPVTRVPVSFFAYFIPLCPKVAWRTGKNL